MKNQTAGKGHRWLVLTIVILVILLALTALGLVARVVYLNNRHNSHTAVVSDNHIGESSVSETKIEDAMASVDESGPSREPDTASSHVVSGSSKETAVSVPEEAAELLTLEKSNPQVNQPFSIRGMLPGDSVTQYYQVKVHHKADLALCFDTAVNAQTKQLGDILMVTVVDGSTGKSLYSGTVNHLQQKPMVQWVPYEGMDASITYVITVSLPTTADNQYQNAMLDGNFRWYVEEEECLDSPQTGDMTYYVLLGACLLVVVAGAAWLVMYRKERRKQYEE